MTPLIAAITAPVLLLSASVVAAELPGARRSPRQSPALQSTPAASEQSAVTITVFSNISGTTEDEWVGAGIVETLTADFERLPGVSVVGDQAGAGARWVISGAYQRLDERMRITARVVEVATGAVVHTAIVDGRVAELFALQDRLAADLRQGLVAGIDGIAMSRTASAPRVGEADRAAAPLRAEPAAPGRGAGVAAPTIIIDGAPAPVAPETITRDAAGRATVRAVSLTEPFRLDGVLDEGFYDTVPSFGGFIQQVPNEGEPATEETEAWVFFDESNVYVSARLWDSAPESQWVANEMRRDATSALYTNERFSATIDTFLRSTQRRLLPGQPHWWIRRLLGQR